MYASYRTFFLGQQVLNDGPFLIWRWYPQQQQVNKWPTNQLRATLPHKTSD